MSCANFETLQKSSSECFSKSNVASENRKRFEINNKSGYPICRIKVDGCLIKDNAVAKCDYWFKVHEIEKNYLVELKGGDISHAIEQICSTYNILLQQKQNLKNCTGIIVSNSIPKNANEAFRKEQKRIFNQYQGLIIKKTTNKHVETI